MIGYLKLVTGNLGGGKTSWLVELMVEHLRAGGSIATNIELKFDEISAWLASEGYEFDPARVTILTGSLDDFYSQIPRGSPTCVVMCAIDEAAIVGFNSRDFAKLNRKVFNFCTLARKLDIGLWWATQRPQFFDKQLRELCLSLIDCRDMRQFRLFGVLPFPIPLLVRVHHEMIGGIPRKAFSEVVSRKRWVWKLYNSDALLGDSAQEFANMTRAVASPLRRIPRPTPLFEPAYALTLCVSFFVSF